VSPRRQSRGEGGGVSEGGAGVDAELPERRAARGLFRWVWGCLGVGFGVIGGAGLLVGGGELGWEVGGSCGHRSKVPN